MEQVEVEILTQAVTAQYGVLKTGDILRTDAEFARHLVEDAKAAKYVKPKADAKNEPEEPKAEAENENEPEKAKAEQAPKHEPVKSVKAK